jgi:hypothetical protein
MLVVMNNTRTLTIVAVFIAASLVVGTFAATPTTQTALAYQKKKGGGEENSRNGNTITIQKCKQAATQSGWDNNQGQECENLICTHPNDNATCVQEQGAAVTTNAITPPVKLTCEQCFTKFLTPEQIAQFTGSGAIPIFCATLESGTVTENDFRRILTDVAEASETTINELIACLQEAGIVFAPLGG